MNCNATDGVVVRAEGEFVWVRVSRHSPCGACSKQGSCRASGFGTLHDDVSVSHQLLRLPNTIATRPGDQVVICAAKGALWHAAWRAYGVPLALSLVGGMAALSLFGSDAGALAGVMTGLGAGFALLRRHARRSAAEPILSLAFKRTL